MRNWYKYTLKEKKINVSDRFEYTDFQLIEDHKNFKENYNFDIFKNNEQGIKTYEYLKKNLQNQETFFIGSSWGWLEFFLSKDFKLIASDINEKYISYHKTNSNLNYIKYDILNENFNDKLKFNFDQIVINNIEYLFDNSQMQIALKNISKLTNINSSIFLIFRSKDSYVINLIDNFFIPLENFLIKIVKRLLGKKLFLTKNHHGFRRNESEMLNIINNNNFVIKSIYKDMYETEYKRLRIFKFLKISKLLSFIFFKQHSHLNIIHFKKVLN